MNISSVIYAATGFFSGGVYPRPYRARVNKNHSDHAAVEMKMPSIRL
jgi:hypothetical protein